MRRLLVDVGHGRSWTHPIPTLSSYFLHQFIPTFPVFFSNFFDVPQRGWGGGGERALLISFLSSDRPYNVKEDVARRQKKMQKSRNSKRQPRKVCWHALYSTKVYLLSISCLYSVSVLYSHMHVTLIIMYTYNVVFTLLPSSFCLWIHNVTVVGIWA